ncbi:MAG TPA: hypothetical protein VEF76_07395 [Patescibacteria group bacterium]|nr:hypothetical protein [Patescibacteria group bacterium]
MRIIAAAFLLVTFVTSAFAGVGESRCVCMPLALEKRWAASQAVFTGTVLEITEVTNETQRGNADIPLIVVVEVEEGFKGVEKGSKFKVYTNQSVNTCMGGDYRLGQKYLFFAYMRTPDVAEKWSMYNFPSGTFDVGGTCGGMQPLANAAAEIEEIRKLPKEDALLPLKDGVAGEIPEKPVRVQ